MVFISRFLIFRARLFRLSPCSTSGFAPKTGSAKKMLCKKEHEDESGTKRYVTEIVADDCEFLTPKAKNSAPDADVEPGYDEDDEP